MSTNDEHGGTESGLSGNALIDAFFANGDDGAAVPAAEDAQEEGGKLPNMHPAT